MKIMIIQGAGWYHDLVGNVVDVKEQTTFFRQENGGPRVEHFVLNSSKTEKVGRMDIIKLIECTHAVCV
ncbi:hypothetical protein [Bacillus safensis]|uniref:hypothetical protein n=1 Tax=Bacillus safensis TaxID=561879 RepID=UPI002E2163C9|nr:hypothetical protein [Bacillus safensis]